MRVTDLLALSHVPRWVNVRHSPAQSVADHSFRVCAIYLELCARLRKDPSLRGLTWALCHDGLEGYTGDIPADFKDTIKEEVGKAETALGVVLAEKPLDSDLRLIKLADRIETFTFISMSGIGPHAERVREICRGQLQESAGDDWNTIRLLVRDIIEETDRT